MRGLKKNTHLELSWCMKRQKSPNQETGLRNRECLKVLNVRQLLLNEHEWPPNHLGSIWQHSEPSDVPYSPNQFLGLDFFLVLTARRLKCEIHLIRLLSSSKTCIMRGPGVFILFIILIFDFFFRLHSLLHSFTMFWRFQRVYSYMSQLWSCCWIEGKASRYVLSCAHFRSLKLFLSFISTEMNCHNSLLFTYLLLVCNVSLIPFFVFGLLLSTKLQKYYVIFV